MKKKLIHVSLFLIVAVLLMGAVSFAGSLTPPGSPSKTMKSLADLYQLVNTGANTPSTDFTTPGTVAPTMNTIGDTYDLLKTQINNLSNAKIAKNISAFGYTGTLYGDIDPTKVLTTATYSGTAVASGISKTGQTSCYLTNNVSYQNPCLDGTNSLGGQDGYYQKGIAMTTYTDNLDGTISDSNTGLMWKKCSEGKTGVTCATGSDTSKTWTEALAACEADVTAGHTDWRLPNIKELLSIVDYTTTFPGNNPLFSSQSNNYFTNTTYQETGSFQYAWVIHFYDGSSSYRSKSNSSYVRCVR